MCPTCPCNDPGVSIPGPVEVAGGVVGVAVGAAISKPGRKILFWGVAVPMLPFAVVGVFGWWTIAIVAAAAAMAAGVLLTVRRLHRHVVVPAATPAQRVAELERRRRNAIPVPAARPALPRGLSVTRRRRALPAAAKALPAPERVITGRVVAAGEKVVR